MPLRTIIVEDEPLSRAFLNNLLSEFCSEINVVATVSSEEEAVVSIELYKPDLVFLDIELQQGTGFEVLKRTYQLNYHVIFTTALDHNGIRAIKFSGVDYLQKPIDIDGLRTTIAAAMKKNENNDGQLAVQHLIHTLQNNNTPLDLLLECGDERNYVNVADIIFVRATDTGCIFKSGSKELNVTGKSFKEFDQMLSGYGFFRVDHSYIVNIDKILPSSKLDKGFVTMEDGSDVTVSPRKVNELKSITQKS